MAQSICFNEMHQHAGHNLTIEPVVRDNVITAFELVCLTCREHDPEEARLLEDERTSNYYAWSDDYPGSTPCKNCGHLLQDHNPLLDNCMHTDKHHRFDCNCDDFWPA